MKIVPAYLLAVPLVVDSIVKLEFKMRYDEGGLKFKKSRNALEEIV